MESNDSPEIPDSGETSDIPGLPSGVCFGNIDIFYCAAKSPVHNIWFNVHLFLCEYMHTHITGVGNLI